MDLPAYVAIMSGQVTVSGQVFDGLFTQYYPFEHMDRPVHPTATPVSTVSTQYDDRRATGPRNTHSAQSQTLDLYAYLRDYIEVLAARLTDLDLTWASTYLSQSPPRVVLMSAGNGFCGTDQQQH